MRRRTGRLSARFSLFFVVAAVIATTLMPSGSTPKAQEPTDIVEALKGIDNLTVVSEDKAPDGFRFFKLTYTQPADHRNPDAGSFEQRLTLLHRDVNAPMVMFTSGYHVSDLPNRSEPTQIVNGNQLSMEYRYFAPSRPVPPQWTKELTIWQAATDQHRIANAFKEIYNKNWLATGGSKGGMTATYFRRFYPNDVSGTIPYVAPNDVADARDTYNEFLANVGTDPGCRDALRAVQRDALVRRNELGKRAEQEAIDTGKTFSTVGSLDKALEIAVIDSYFAFWQYQKQSDCETVPAPGAPLDELYAFFDKVESLLTYSDQDLDKYVPYYYQAAVQLGAPESYEGHLKDLLRFPGSNKPSTFVPPSVPLAGFDYPAMQDIDLWVRFAGKRMLFVYGENDPWTAEPFELSVGSLDSYRYFVSEGNHGARISQLPQEEADKARSTIRRWAGVSTDDKTSARSFNATAFPNFDADLLVTNRPRL